MPFAPSGALHAGSIASALAKRGTADAGARRTVPMLTASAYHRRDADAWLAGDAREPIHARLLGCGRAARVDHTARSASDHARTRARARTDASDLALRGAHRHAGVVRVRDARHGLPAL